jgi:hypothetical protein
MPFMNRIVAVGDPRSGSHAAGFGGDFGCVCTAFHAICRSIPAAAGTVRRPLSRARNGFVDGADLGLKKRMMGRPR